jgi:hypothetical protein
VLGLRRKRKATKVPRVGAAGFDSYYSHKATNPKAPTSSPLLSSPAAAAAAKKHKARLTRRKRRGPFPICKVIAG